MAAQQDRSNSGNRPGPLAGIRVIELADEQAEYCGLTLAGLGAEVIKIEPPGGNSTRRIGPFYEDQEGPERSLFFWYYNRGKKSITLDFEQQKDRDRLRALVASADILLESTPKGELDRLGMGKDALAKEFPTLIHARVTPFGDDGPWANFKSSDLVHLALGGVMMNCGYDPDPFRQVRSAADRAADVARVSRRRRAALLHAARRAALPVPHGQGPARLVRRARVGVEIHRGRSHDVGHAPRAGPAPDLPPRARRRFAEPDHRAHEGRPLGDGEPGQSRGRRRAAAEAPQQLRPR